MSTILIEGQHCTNGDITCVEVEDLMQTCHRHNAPAQHTRDAVYLTCFRGVHSSGRSPLVNRALQALVLCDCLVRRLCLQASLLVPEQLLVSGAYQAICYLQAMWVS